MNRGLSLTALASKIEGMKALKADYLAPAKDLRIEIQSDNTPILTTPYSAHGRGGFPILPIAHDKIAARLNIPAAYYNRMRTTAPDLLATNANLWLGRDAGSRMLRTLGGDLRAFLSDKFSRVENEEIAEVVLPILLETPQIEITACEVTERRMYIIATTSRVQGEVRKGDVVQAGVLISNSEVGQGAVSIRPMVYRLVCLNGMVLPDGKLTARHVGRRIGQAEDLNAIFSEEARKADDRALLLKVRDVVRHSLDEAVFGRAVEKMQGLSHVFIAGDPAKSVELLARKVGATEDERGGILRALIHGGDLSAYGMLNAVTFQAHAAPAFDRAVEFEQMGGALLQLPRSEWNEILTAA